MNYRREIDGLRAVAVLPVILFHAGFKFFSGGYVGVDVFFVISGYLITSIIIAEKKEGTFSLIGFYERRARRILPALFFVIMACLPFAYFWMSPNYIKYFSESLVAVSVFTSNFLFFIQSGYFDTQSGLKPLLHTWSLAVEEQYYLLFPLFLLLTWRCGKQWVVSILIALAIFSLALAEWSSFNHTAANFYLLPTRGWELLIGCFIAFFQDARKGKLEQYTGTMASKLFGQWLSFVGLFSITFAVLTFNEATRYPSLLALIPTLGAALIILFATQKSLIGRFLGSKLLVGIGLISYSAYLWHQPLFVFARLTSVEKPSELRLGFLVIFAILLGYFTWKYIESPFRDRKRYKRKTVFILAALLSSMMIGLGLIGYFYPELVSRTSQETKRILSTAKPSPKSGECLTGGKSYLKPLDACMYSGSSEKWAVMGDSHVVELAYALSREVEKYGEGVKHLSYSGCAPAYTVELKDKESTCAEWTREAIQYIISKPEIKYVVVGYRYSYHFFGDNLNTYPILPDESPQLEFDGTTDAKREILAKALMDMLVTLNNAGKKVFVVMPIPELGKRAEDIIFLNKEVLHRSGEIIGVSVQYYTERNKYIREKLLRLSESNITVIDPMNILCDKINCYITKNDEALYFDDNHLSVAGAGLIAREIIKYVKR